MRAPRNLAMWSEASAPANWSPTTLAELEKSEEFFENVLAESPGLLNLDSRRSGIHGPYKIFRQLPLNTPFGRTIYPDIVLLSDSGHIIVVEVKRSVNQELRDRSVIAQIVDYAASFADGSEDDFLLLFGKESRADTWGDFIAELFPTATDQRDLAATLHERINDGALNPVIACDRIPPELPEVVRGIANQSSLGFELDLVEVVPYVNSSTPSDDILFVPSTHLTTEIVARTAVTVIYRQGDKKPSTRVETTSMEEIEENIRTVSESGVWIVEETEEAFEQEGSNVLIDLLEFSKQHSYQGQIIANNLKKFSTFGFYVPLVIDDGSRKTRMVFSCTQGWSAINVYLSRIKNFVSPELKSEFVRRMEKALGNHIDSTQSELFLALSDFETKLDAFKNVVLWLKNSLESAK